MDFFEAQERSLRGSRRLVLLFGLAVAGMMAVVYFAVLLVLGVVPLETFVGLEGLPGPEAAGLFRPGVLAAVVVGMGAVIGGGTAFRTSQLRRGGPAVAELLGGRRVDPATDDPRERILLNVVEEMAIASGLPVPAVYVMDREEGINAFAAGHAADDAAVAVTRGTLEAMTRDELQGVVAHEFSHILNGDMRLNVRLMGLLFGILLLAVVGRGLLRGSMWGGRRAGSGGRGGGAQIAVLGLVLVLLGYLGVVFGRLIQAAVSRQREFLADAAAVQFTRNPEGIAGALKRIGAASHGSRIRDHHAEEAGHLFFAAGLSSALGRLTSTHPPLAERIRRIDRHWDGSFDVPPAAARPSGSRPAAPPAPGTSRPGARSSFPFPAFAQAVAGSVGSPGPGHLARARHLLQEIPPSLRDALRTPNGAVAAVVALLLPADAGLRAAHEAPISSALGTSTARQALELANALEAMGPEGRLPILDLALPHLRELPPERARALLEVVGRLAGTGEGIRTFAFALYHVLRRNLPESAGRGRPRRPDRVPLTRLRRETELLLSAVARVGSDDEGEVERAFAAGQARLPPKLGPWRLQPAGALSLARVDEALDRAERGAPAARKALLDAAVAAVGADGRVEAAEAELLRALAEALELPLPPILHPEGVDERTSAG